MPLSETTPSSDLVTTQARQEIRSGGATSDERTTPIDLHEPFRLAHAPPLTMHAGSGRTTETRASAARAGGGNAAPQCQLETTAGM
ncbi:hypothetical protein HBI56_240150 [Parastagonospora nodorum]|uniref:Uncharacterized protein n=2 Tax=Phaeosphaeria nodorum (strain SN15 / ATCC MYA-4574 / FGSC 10173) TaxID=321614 RepID=A0A7U2EVW9_PHANO|nr:hypothetical protein SNOG_16570 [Parastagonospora nodorum SN15]KAH3903728.1 hypothetical protein HBH56_247390 [Parastagonospora nodorum]EAT76058.1 hypothetical protein SNOG_16570 [Parastagonospora nodorum SN15]KAH3921032.1 hypothetical protein HBH54_248290 [Parastagonospora nodorum]KAH3938529.1 hypothetical protein HBH53_251600 [Parastagonospora nodorum]KAH3956184.1 hypothetical protein HBH51_249660 [Parastagonospora nodorum]